MVRKSCVEIQYSSFQVLKKREGILVIVQDERDQFILDCFVNGGKLYVDFFSSVLCDYESPEDALKRLMQEKSLLYGDLVVLEPLYPSFGELECIYLFVAKKAHIMGNDQYLICDLEMTLKYLQTGVFASEEAKQAMMHYLR